MTDFKVTDEAVEVACVAHYSAWLRFHQHERETFRKEMRAAIEDVLPVMFEEVGYIYNIHEDVDGFFERDLCVTADLQHLPIGTKVYAIKEPK